MNCIDVHVHVSNEDPVALAIFHSELNDHPSTTPFPRQLLKKQLHQHYSQILALERAKLPNTLPTPHSVPRSALPGRSLPLRDPTSPKISYLPPGHTEARIRARKEARYGTGSTHPSPTLGTPQEASRPSVLRSEIAMNSKRLRTRSDNLDLRGCLKGNRSFNTQMVFPGLCDRLDLDGGDRKSFSSTSEVSRMLTSNDASSSSTAVHLAPLIQNLRNINETYAADEDSDADSILSDDSGPSWSLDDSDALLLRLAAAALEMKQMESDLLLIDSDVTTIEARLSALQKEILAS